MIYTTYYANLKNLPCTVTPVAISRSMPEGMRITHLTQLAPTWSTVTKYKHGGDWAEFKSAYYRWLERIDLGELTDLLPKGDIALVCYEKDPAVCHRSLLAEWFRETLGLDVREWGAK